MHLAPHVSMRLDEPLAIRYDGIIVHNAAWQERV